MSYKNLKILLYHGVSDCVNYRGIENFSKKHISKKIFYKQMKFLKENCNVISINDLDKFRKKKIIPKNTVLVTFDDGFENNYKVAVPILKKFKVPSIFYISSGMIGKKELFWVDKIEDIINRCKKKMITLTLDKKKKFNLKTKSCKIKAVQNIKKFCKNSAAYKKDLIIKDLSKETGVVPNSKLSKNYKIMTWDHVKKIASNKLFDIGGHSLDHNILSKLPVTQMKNNIKRSIKILEKKLKKKIIHYSYPEGQAHDYNKDVKKYLRSLGIECCPTAINGIAKIDGDKFELKRIMVGINDKKFPFKSFN